MRAQVKILLLVFICLGLAAKENVKDIQSDPLKVYYDGGGSLFRFLRNDINFIQFVRDPLDAQILLQINSQSTGDGGKKFSFYFTGQKFFEDMNDTLITTLPANKSDAERYNEIVRIVKLGLVPYLNKTPYNKYLNVVSQINIPKEPEEDKWDSWVFSIGLNGSIEGEEAKREFLYEADLGVNRVKKGSKIKINGSFSNELKEFEEDDEISTNHKRNRRLSVLYVNSVSEHFSAGISGDVKSKTYENLRTGFNFAPAVEYNIFPYDESIRRNFTFLYRIGYSYNKYYQPTIYMKEEENLFNQSLKIDYELKEIWGELDMYLAASNYLHDFKKNRIDFRTRVSFRLSGSFFFNVLLYASYVNDQLYLPSEGASLEDILLNQIELSTQYQYELKFGVRYTFGSIYNSVVNTRF
jgi:hypothetical protein